MKRVKEKRIEWHVVQRAVRRLLLVRDEEDYRTYCGILGTTSRSSEVTVISHALMSNHAHQQVRADSDQLTEFMSKANKAYADFHNEKYGFKGHVFEGPYFCKPVRTPFYSVRLSRYIHLNPVRAGVVSMPDAYPWSSCRRYFDGTSSPVSCDTTPILGQFGRTPDQAREAYRKFVLSDLNRPSRRPRRESPASEMWREEFRWLLEAARSVPIPPGLTPEDLAIVWAVECGIPPRSISQVLSPLTNRQVSVRAYRLENRIAGSPELLALLENLQVQALSTPRRDTITPVAIVSPQVINVTGGIVTGR